MDASEIEQWRLADAEFERMLELPDDQRLAALAALAATDPALHRKVQGLINAHESDGVLDRARIPLFVAVPDGLSGRRLGRWRLEHEIGRGGMSVVYSAQALEGAVGRDAAVKVLTLGTLAGDGGRYFVREQAMLVRLRHPYIVPLYDAGVARDGTPWLAMARVKGRPIDAWCDVRRLDDRGRVALLLQVCEAVSHAHRNLVIHRDIKPSNVLVDEDGCVRLLDFGVASLIEPGGDRTATMLRALTPEYAAPEQFSGDPAATTMDVYGIGALLHRILAGAPPAVSRGRSGTVHSAPVRLLRGDLEAIAGKATAERPDDRYASVDALAGDLRRWLAGHPVKARPPSLRYRARRFVSRHRLAAGVSLALGLAIISGLGATFWQARNARHEAERAVATRDFLVQILESANPAHTRGEDPPASELLRRGAESIDSGLSHRPALRADLLLVIGRTQLARGLVGDAAATLDRALALFEEGLVKDDVALAAALSERAMASYEQGALATAVAQLERADALLAGRERGRGYSPQREVTRSSLADMLVVAQHRADEGATIARELVEHLRRTGRTGSIEYPRALRSLGAAADLNDRPEEAVEWLLQAQRELQGHPDAEDEQATLQNELGIAYLRTGRMDQAQRAFEAALAIQRRLFGEMHPATLNTRGNLATLYLRQGRVDDAAAEYERTLGLKREMLGTDLHPDVISDLGWLALARYQAGETAVAWGLAEQGWDLAAQLPEADRVALRWLAPLAGLLRLELGQPDPDRLLHAGEFDCTPSNVTSLSHWICTARAWQARLGGDCLPPPMAPMEAGDLQGVDRRWWIAHWLVRAQCGGPAHDQEAARVVQRLAATDVPLPQWLAREIEASGILALE